MPHLVVISHKLDSFTRRSFLLRSIVEELENAGVAIEVTRGTKRFVPADLAILHVNQTVIDPKYRELAKRYPRTLNLAVGNVGKSRISDALLSRHDTWPGRVIVKTELNSRGMPELYHNRMAEKRGRPAPYPAVTGLREYALHDRLSDVPDEVWRDPQLVVEKFIPEPDPGGFALRTWLFLGGRETCSRCVSPDPVVKGNSVVTRELISVPEELRQVRKRLGFDYGKFDFVLHDGRPILFDANHTPTIPQNLSDALRHSTRELAQGLLELLRER